MPGVLSKYRSAQSPLGAVRPAQTAKILSVEGSQEWLLQRWAVAYEAKYVPLLSEGHLHLLTAAAPEVKSLALSNTFSSVRPAARLFWSATAAKYLLVGVGTGGASPASEYAVGATIAGLVEAVYPATSNGCTDAAQFADGSVITVHAGSLANSGTYFPGATLTPATKTIGTGNRDTVAALGAVGVAFNGGGAATNTANQINVTTDNGATWSADQTGTNGAITGAALKALHGSIPANLFLWIGDDATTTNVLSSTPADPKTQTTRYTSTTFRVSACGKPWRAASSPTVTLIAGKGRKLLRTTDGINYTEVLPEVLSGYQLASPQQVAFTDTAVAYDPDSGYFYAWLDASSHNHIGTLPDFAVRVLRSTDGLAWEPCVPFEPETTGRTCQGYLFANGQKLLAISTSSNEINSLRDAAAGLARQPAFVRAGEVSFSTTVFGQVRIK